MERKDPLSLIISALALVVSIVALSRQVYQERMQKTREENRRVVSAFELGTRLIPVAEIRQALEERSESIRDLDEAKEKLQDATERAQSLAQSLDLELNLSSLDVWAGAGQAAIYSPIFSSVEEALMVRYGDQPRAAFELGKLIGYIEPHVPLDSSDPGPDEWFLHHYTNTWVPKVNGILASLGIRERLSPKWHGQETGLLIGQIRLAVHKNFKVG